MNVAPAPFGWTMGEKTLYYVEALDAALRRFHHPFHAADYVERPFAELDDILLNATRIGDIHLAEQV